jgi:hypothetical protein
MKSPKSGGLGTARRAGLNGWPPAAVVAEPDDARPSWRCGRPDGKSRWAVRRSGAARGATVRNAAFPGGQEFPRVEILDLHPDGR